MHCVTFLHDKAAQGGKSKPDSYSAIIKAQVTRSVDAGNDCSNAKNFAKCIAMNTGVSNVVVMLGVLKDIKDRRKLKQEITGIRDFNTFVFNDEGNYSDILLSYFCGLMLQFRYESVLIAKWTIFFRDCLPQGWTHWQRSNSQSNWKTTTDEEVV